MQEVRYFDGNATTPVCHEAKFAWEEASSGWWYNSSSPFSLGAAVKVRLERERERLASILGAKTEEVVFNSGATEGNNTIFSNWGASCPSDKVVLISSIEHPSATAPAKHHLGNRLVEIPVGSGGLLDIEMLADKLKRGNVWGCSVMAANNETGVLQPWQDIRDLCQGYGVFFHTDAAQWIGKMPSGGIGSCDFVTGCAHKFGGPKGCGFLKLSNAGMSSGLLRGGNQEGGYRAGTEDYAGVSSMMAALTTHEALLSDDRDHFENLVKERVPNVRIIGDGILRLPQTSMLILPTFDNHRWVTHLAKKGFLVSTGSACSTINEDGSRVLKAMGYTPEQIKRAVRISGGRWNRENEWSELAIAIEEVWQELQQPSGKAKVVEID